MVHKYQVGKSIEKHDVDHIAIFIQDMLKDKEGMKEWKKNANQASKILNWENEKKVISNLF